MFLFYHNVDKEIEKATAAQLEGYIAMKTKAITNSIPKWAERLTFKVKLVIAWLRTGGEKNEEAIEQLDKQKRD